MAGKRKINKKYSGLLTAIVVIIACAVWLINSSDIFNSDKAKQASSDKVDTQVHFVDVGQGDTTLVISGSEAMLVDTGERDDKNTLLDYLKDMEIKSLKYLIITHPHSDHMGEASEVITSFDTQNIIMPKITGDMTPTSSVYSTFIKTVKSQGKKITSAKDEELSLGNSKIFLYTTKEEHKDLNNYSVLVKVVHDDNSFLITGDCEKEEEKEMLSQGFDLSADVLKAGHHGSSTSSSEEFLNAVRPDYAVISCGRDNKYGHPHEETVKRLKEFASDLYTTVENGSIVFYSDGKGLTVKTEKQSVGE